MTLLGLCVPVKVLGIDEIANAWYPGRVDPTIKDHSPINTSEPFVSFNFFRTVLKIIKQIRDVRIGNLPWRNRGAESDPHIGRI